MIRDLRLKHFCSFDFTLVECCLHLSGEKNFVLRVGALIFENVGQLATNQMADCHSSKAIYPLGYRATRLFWSQTVRISFNAFLLCNIDL